MTAHSSSVRLQAAMAKACFGKDAPFEKDLRGFLASHGVAKEDIEALVAAPRRLGLYRQLVRHNVIGVINDMLGRTRARLDVLVPGSFDTAIAAFLDDVGPTTPHMRDVPAEFLAHAAPAWRKDERVPRWIADYAELELVDFTIGVAPRPLPPPPLAEVSADRPLVFADPRTLITLAWSVHEMPEDDVRAVPAERPVTLLVYRDGEHRTRFLELTPLAGRIMERLFAGDPLGPAMVAACNAEGHPLNEDVLTGAAKLLADLGERGVLLGAKS